MPQWISTPGINEDGAFRALVLEIPDRWRPAEAIDHHDLPGHIHIAKRREVEEIGAAPGGEALDADALAANALSCRADS